MDVQEVGTYFYLGQIHSKSSQVRGVLWKSEAPVFEPGSSGFQQLYHYLARDLPFHPSFILSHTARHFYCSGEAILWRFKDLTKDFKGQRWDLGDFNPEVPDPPSGIDFKPFSPWATVQNHSFCPISLPRIDLFDSFGRTPTFRP